MVPGLTVARVSGETQFALTSHLGVGAVLAGAGELALHENTTVNFKNDHLRLKDIFPTFKL